MRTFPTDFDAVDRPILLSGMAKSWPAFGAWSFSSLAARSAGVRVPVHTGRYRARMNGKTAERDGAAQWMTVADWVERMSAGGGVGYLAGLELLRGVPALRAECAFPPATRSPTAVDVIWLGAAGTLTQLHFDRSLNINALIVGRKRFSFYRPDRTGLAPRPVTWTHSMSALDLGSEEAFEASGVRPDLELDVDAGDALFIPYGWWHRVRTIEPSIAVNRWWWSTRTIRARAVDAGAALLGLRDGPPLA
ncbi:MAG: cupin-like domain-containing protein [Deltaproteobacteria bacterium]|nr:cupin-like domain-containing protein [Deltaproteobacteria bacterium]